jgi:hypothetical protein
MYSFFQTGVFEAVKALSLWDIISPKIPKATGTVPYGTVTDDRWAQEHNTTEATGREETPISHHSITSRLEDGGG